MDPLSYKVRERQVDRFGTAELSKYRYALEKKKTQGRIIFFLAEKYQNKFSNQNFMLCQRGSEYADCIPWRGV